MNNNAITNRKRLDISGRDNEPKPKIEKLDTRVIQDREIDLIKFKVNEIIDHLNSPSR